MVAAAPSHSGFIIPNAGDVSNSRMAEPDRIDFNIIAHARWGVIDGCQVTVSGATAIILPGTALVNGSMVSVAGGSLSLALSTSQDRFDLIVVDQAGSALVVAGTPSLDPVFPDPGLNVTVLAAVFAPTGVADLSLNVVDKRKFISRALLTKIDAAAPLVQNMNGSGDHFKVTGGGTITWEGDTTLSRSAAATLNVQSKLTVEDSIVAAGSIGGLAVTAVARVQGSNLQTGPTLPGFGLRQQGSLFQNESDGRLYVWKNSAWSEIATVNGTVPTGTIIDSVEAKDVMIARGWVPLDGGTITEAQYPNLFSITALAGFISGSPGSRTMRMPNAEGRVRMTTWAGAGTLGGSASNSRTLTVDNMPRHNHSVASGPAGAGAVNVTVLDSSAHGHGISGGAHSHYSVFAPTGDILTPGTTPIAPFGEFDAPYGSALAGWVVGPQGTDHAHTIAQSGVHSHSAYTSALADHVHVLTQADMGLGAAFDVTPSYLAVFTYIRS